MTSIYHSNSSTHEDHRSTEFLLSAHLAFLYRPELVSTLLDTFPSLPQFFAILNGNFKPTLAQEEFIQNLNPRFRKRLQKGHWQGEAQKEIHILKKRGVEAIDITTAEYPPLLKEISHAPLILFSKGSPIHSLPLTVGLIGTRRPSPYGERQAQRFSRELAKMGVTIVSGLARGVDSLGHRAALEVGGQTIAVLGSGLGKIYPHENKRLAQQIQEKKQGALISEFPFDVKPFKHHFPLRNRLISGMSQALLVIEASEKSGTLHTVDWALEQNRPVFVLPGRVEDEEAQGCLHLIQGGAYPVVHPREILDFLSSKVPSKFRTIEERPLSECRPEQNLQDPFLKRLLPLFKQKDLWHPDELSQSLNESPLELLAKINQLENEGYLSRQGGGCYSLGISSVE